MITDVLKRAPLFSSLTDDQLAKVAAIVRTQEVEEETGLFVQGDVADSFYMIARGKVKIFKTLRDGRTATLRHVQPGETFGESVLFTDEYPSSAETMTDCVLIKIPTVAFRQLLIAEPEVGIALIAAMARLLVLLNQRVEELLLPVPARLARYVLDLRDSQCTMTISCKSCSGCQLPTSKRELAARLGTVPETLSRTLDRFKRSGLIALNGSNIEVLDIPGMERLAQR